MSAGSRLFSRLITAATVLLTLSACAVHQSPLQNVEKEEQSPESQMRWQSHQAQMSEINSWSLKGKIAVKAGNKGGHASIRWVKRETEHIELFGPLGGGRVEIDADTHGVTLKDTKGGALQGASISSLIEQRLGWPLPFDQLPNWLRGLPASDEAEIQWDDSGRITHMNDQGWQVSYPEYQALSFEARQEIDVPRVIELNALPGTLKVYDKGGEFMGEEFFVRLIVKSWIP